MVAWVYYNDKTNELLGSSKLVMLGYPEDQSSYQSKISGIYGIAATIMEMELFHDLQGSSIKVACNRESALHRCFKPWVSNPLAKHSDMIQATQALIKKTPIIIWSWEHVKGHQDNKDQLTNTEQWNVKMDKAAKEH